MTRDELKEALCDAYEVDYHFDGEKGVVIDDRYSWECGCYNNHQWLSLSDVYDVLSDLCEEDE